MQYHLHRLRLYRDLMRQFRGDASAAYREMSGITDGCLDKLQKGEDILLNDVLILMAYGGGTPNWYMHPDSEGSIYYDYRNDSH